MVVVVEPESQLATGIRQGKEHLDVAALIPQPSVEALDITVLDGRMKQSTVDMASQQASS